MSYMGVKGICVDLEKRGLLDTWREPQQRGRPQILYRLTTKAHDLFPTASSDLTVELLRAAQRLYGSSAADKLLLLAFQKKAEQFVSKLSGRTLDERTESLAKLRDQDGCMAEFQAAAGAFTSPRIVEHHSPILDILRAFPIVAKFEVEMFQKILGVAVKREERCASGLYCATFFVGN